MMMPKNIQSFPTAPYERALLRSQQSLRWGLGAALAVLLSLVTLPPASTAWTVALRQQLSEQIQTFEVARLRVENNVQTRQAATRGYVITQQPAFLDDYGTAASQVPTDLARLHDLASAIDPR